MSDPTPSHTVLLVHGIRTQAEWQQTVLRVLQEDASVRVIPTRYEFFDVVRFLAPFSALRRRPVARITRLIRDELGNPRTQKLSVIAHSFGTWIICKILQDEPDIRLHRVVFCGSVVVDSFEWQRYAGQLGGGDWVSHSPVVNDCGHRDIWPVLATSITSRYGSSGRFGFGHTRVRDRFHRAAHSDFFSEKFVRDYWKPFISAGLINPNLAELPRAPWWVSILTVPGFKLRHSIPALILAVALAAWVNEPDFSSIAPLPAVSNLRFVPLQGPAIALNVTSTEAALQSDEAPVTGSGLSPPLDISRHAAVIEDKPPQSDLASPGGKSKAAEPITVPGQSGDQQRNTFRLNESQTQPLAGAGVEMVGKAGSEDGPAAKRIPVYRGYPAPSKGRTTDAPKRETRTYSVLVKVVDEADIPVPGVTIEAPSAVPGVAISSESGEAQVRFTDVGDHAMSASHDGFRLAKVVVSVTGRDQQQTQTLRLVRGRRD